MLVKRPRVSASPRILVSTEALLVLCNSKIGLLRSISRCYESQ